MEENETILNITRHFPSNSSFFSPNESSSQTNISLIANKLLYNSNNSSHSPNYTHNVLFEYILIGIGITTVSILGLFGNIISGLVLSRARMRSSMSCFLLGLAFSDSVLILCSLLLFGIPTLVLFVGDPTKSGFMNYFIRVWGPYVYAVAITGQTASVYFTIGVTIERYLVVCVPLKARSHCTWARAQFWSFFVIFFSLFYNIPRWWELKGWELDSVSYNLVNGENEDENYSFSYQLEYTEMRTDALYVTYYINWGYLLIMCIFPFCILVTLNLLIYNAIRSSNKSRVDIMKGQRSKDYSFAWILFSVVLTFLFCNTLALVVNLMESMWKTTSIDLENISNFLITLNSSVNCGIYCACGNKFRTQLKELRDEILEFLLRRKKVVEKPSMKIYLTRRHHSV